MDSIQCQAMGEGLVLGSYQFNNYKTDKSKLFELDSVTVLNSESEMIQKGLKIGSSICDARDIANHPGNITTNSII